MELVAAIFASSQNSLDYAMHSSVASNSLDEDFALMEQGTVRIVNKVVDLIVF
jgi:hypothetical protein